MVFLVPIHSMYWYQKNICPYISLEWYGSVVRYGTVQWYSFLVRYGTVVQFSGTVRFTCTVFGYICLIHYDAIVRFN